MSGARHRRRPEAAIQRAVFEHLRVRAAPGVFAAGLIPSMAKSEMQRVYRLLREAREDGTVPWEWIVDETRELERVSTWNDPAQYARVVARSYRRDSLHSSPRRRLCR